MAMAAMPPTTRRPPITVTSSAPTTADRAIHFASVGCSRDQVTSLATSSPVAAESDFTSGSRVLPSTCANTPPVFLSSCTAFSEVATREAYSACMLPPYFCASATLSKLVLSRSRLVNSGAIAPTDSLPNSWVNVAVCMSFGSFRMRSSTSMIVPPESACMALANFTESRPSAFMAACWRGIAAVPAVKRSSMFLMPVAAISSSTPMPAMVAPNAASGPDCKPATSPSAPILFTTAEIFWTLAGPVLPR